MFKFSDRAINYVLNKKNRRLSLLVIGYLSVSKHKISRSLRLHNASENRINWNGLILAQLNGLTRDKRIMYPYSVGDSSSFLHSIGSVGEQDEIGLQVFSSHARMKLSLLLLSRNKLE